MVEYVPRPSKPEEEAVSVTMLEKPIIFNESSLTQRIEDVMGELEPEGLESIAMPPEVG